MLAKPRQYKKLLDDCRLIRRSGLFDETWYLKTYPNVAAAGMDAAEHYLLQGGFEGSDPGPNFSSSHYLSLYDDVRVAKINPLLHYLVYGQKEGRMIIGQQLANRHADELARLSIRVTAGEERIANLVEEVARLSSQVVDKEAQIADQNVALTQLQTILKRETDLPLPPPKHLQVRVVGGYPPDFIESGYYSVFRDLSQALEPAGKELKDFSKILDFGCGCGRAVRALATLLPESRMHGTDIDAEAIGWLQDNYARFGEYSVAPPRPPTVYDDRTFDLIYGISVLTHLPEDMQFEWLKELERIIKPGGYVILTTHGEKFYRPMGAKVNRIMDETGFFYCEPGFNYGRSISLPDFYQNAYHSHIYIRREWSRYFDVVDIQALGMDHHQDTVLLHKRAV